MRRTADAILVGLAVVHGAAITTWPVAPLIAIGLWWNSNTIAHCFIHRPFFRTRVSNRLFAAYQSVVTGIPQTIWRERHLAHHAGVEWHPRVSPALVVEGALVVGLWLGLALLAPAFFVTTYVPGYLAGLVMCAIHGHYEHAQATTSHYGRLYNVLCFNDGFHVEHHQFPGVHWSELPSRIQIGARSSPWPALVRWLDVFTLDRLEGLVLRSRLLQHAVVAAHRRAFRRLLVGVGPIRSALIVGGGLFPRTAIVLRQLAPEADLLVVDANVSNLEVGRGVLERDDVWRSAGIRFECRRFTGSDESDRHDLIVVPLALDGDRNHLYEHPPARIVIVHDWCWRRRGEGRLVSWLLLKRLNLVRR
jgi:hypothetical protein